MQNLNGNPLPWLLDPEDPSVRTWRLVDILDRPPHDPDVQKVRAAITQQPLVKELFALQHPEGYWGDDETKAPSTLKALAVHGYAHDLRFVRLLDLLLNRQDEQGRWLCGSVSRNWPIEKCNRPSKWITLDVLWVLKYAEYH